MRPARKGTRLGVTRLEREVVLAFYRRIRQRILDGLDPDLAIHNAYLGLCQLRLDLLLQDIDENVGELSRVRKRLLGAPIGTAPAQPLGLRGANAYDFAVIAETRGEFGRKLLANLRNLAHRAAGLLITGQLLRQARGAFRAALRDDSDPGFRAAGRLAWCMAGLGVPELVAKSILEAFAAQARPVDGRIRRSTLSRAWATAYRKQQPRTSVPVTLAEWELQLRRIFGVRLSQREVDLERATTEAREREAAAPAFVMTDPVAIKAIADLRAMRETRVDWRISWRASARRVLADADGARDAA